MITYLSQSLEVWNPVKYIMVPWSCLFEFTNFSNLQNLKSITVKMISKFAVWLEMDLKSTNQIIFICIPFRSVIIFCSPFLCWVCRRTPRISYNILFTFLCWVCRRTPRIKAEGELGRKSRRFSLGTGPNKLSKSRSVPELQPAEEYKLRKEKQKEYVLKICIDSANS